ncbi:MULTISPECIES: D-2-hydroxyacid dehydrogenase family protein [Marinomonas]|uniref:D-2-hydroxyacid dehydrogenase family protein n=1 Tax=Marinomonas arctica TaxID=383750 RepID=A0A7H1J2N6_9GAMM|nr:MULTISPECIES: D-2-hydroxyacid dehydrogenase family protein [Marinomonas]MCS7486466.1 3-phosphoglycerate dehydrogenase [Marinomonas sp. BSi20414]QNT04752.1 D-2-hydroxyacid dehydrogenase family protein [Marinomonas arctica]GGN30660.1 D-3-phosphoglycerate dehydrogenase [Marinomonas arctica]
MKIAVLDDYQDAVKDLSCFCLLQGHDVHVFNETFSKTDDLVDKLKDFEALVLIRERTVITEALLANLPNLKLISQTGKISNHIDAKLCHQYGVAVAEGVGSPVAPSELCWGLIMSASRHIPEYVAQFSQGHWQQSGSLGLGRVLNGSVLGIWGYGKIGQRIAQYAKAFGMKVLVWGSESSRTLAQQHGLTAASSKAEFFQSADIVTLHLRLNDATKAIVTQKDLALMKPDSLLVNTSRAELIESDALYREMLSNPSKRAAVDVFETEPANADNQPLLSLPNVLCTPHIGYVEKASYELYFEKAFENVVAFADGKPQNIVLV